MASVSNTRQHKNLSAAGKHSYAAHIPANWTSWTDLPLTVQRALDELISRSFGKHPILDGDVHTDSADQDVTNGSIIVANKTPKWDELVVGAAGEVLWVSVDTPVWHTLAGADIAHTMLDGASHTDSVADGVTQGSLIVGNGTPKWDELVVGVDAQYLGTDGTDTAWQGLDIVDDPSPQLGADLDCNTFDITGITNLESAGNITIDAASAAASYLYLKNTGAGVLQVWLETDSYLVFGEGGVYLRRSALNSLQVRGSALVALDSDTLIQSTASHQMDEGVFLPTDKKITFHDAGIYIHASADGNMKADADVLMTLGHTGVTRIGDGATHYAQFAADGELTLVGTARVLRNQEVDLSSAKLGVGSPPAAGTEDEFPTIDFDKTNIEEVFFKVHTPADYATGTDVEIHLDFFVDTVDAGTQRAVVWGAEYKVVQHGDTFDFDAGTATVGETCEIPIATGNKDLLTCESMTFIAANLPGEGLLLVRVFRNATHGDDDHDGDARLAFIHLEYTAGSLGTAT